MITKFKIFENSKNETNLSIEQMDRLEDGLCLSIYKGKKRDNNKSTNYKILEIKKIETFLNNISISGKTKTTKSKIHIELSNKDKISGEYIKIEESGEIEENSIKIEINDKIVYHLDNKDYNNNLLIEKIVEFYKKHIMKSWKVR
ncbi:hypothetical protein M0Q50_10215 [bacterium]|jgi:hypothetical protein|nr:hypothetical protein [bacterium]